MVSVAAAAWFMTRSLGAKSLWIDEALSVSYAHQSLRDLFPFFIHGEMNMAFYHVLLHFWLGFGERETAIRSLSVLFALAAIPFAYATCARLFSRRAGALASITLALNGVFYSYAREARSYSLVVLLVVAASYFLVRALDEHRRSWWGAYVLAMALAVYAHFFALFVAAAHFLSVFVGRRSRADRVRIAVASTAILALAVPALLYISSGNTELTTSRAKSLSDVPELFRWYAVNNRPMLAVYAIGALASLVHIVVNLRRGQAREAWPRLFVLTWLIVPIVGALIVSNTIDPIFEPRYLLVSFPALVYLVAGGIAALRPLLLVIVLSAALTAASVRSLRLCEPGCATPTQDFRAATSLVLTHASARDQVLFDPPYLRVAYDYYERLEARRANERVTPDKGDSFAHSTRAWLLSDLGDPNRLKSRRLVRVLQDRYERLATRRFPSALELTLWKRRPSS